MNRFLTFILLVSLSAQSQTEINFPEVIYGKENISASWVSHPDVKGGEDTVLLFRNTFEVEDSKADFIINISADNHYYLYVNGRFITHGPQLSDIQHYKYETLNLKDYLKQGEMSLPLR